MSNPFAKPGRWFKANLHAHTTESDGKLSPAQAALHYRRYGYDVLAITDHEKVTPVHELSTPDFLCLEGIEISSQNGLYHIVGLGVSEKFCDYPRDDVQGTLEAIATAGGIGIIAHPYWSCLTAQELLGLRHCWGIEIINYGCEREIAKGISSVHWDDLLRRGERYFACGVDDGHRCGWDFYGGFTMIKAEALSREAILEALRRGDCYASMGPLIYELQVTEETIVVECSPAAAIHFVANDQQGYCVHKEERPPLTGARHLRSSRERYVRVEIVDERGLKAWSQPIWREEPQ